MSKRVESMLRSTLYHIKYTAHFNELQTDNDKLQIYLKSLVAENEVLNEQVNKLKHNIEEKRTNNCNSEVSTKQVKNSVETSERNRTEEVYNRLSQSNITLKSEYYKAQKEAKESQYCTFKPDLPKAWRNTGDTRKAYERLHNEAEIIQQSRKLKQLALTDKEIESCTFTPSINEKRTTSVNSKFEKLYKDHEKNKKRLAEQELIRDQEEIERCTFKPYLNKKSKEDVENVVPRYEQLYFKHGQKLQLLEQKRKEIAEEEKRMREFIAKDLKNLPSSHDNRFERLYNMTKVYMENKKALEKKVMKETGISFSPNITVRPTAFTSKQSAKRNESFALNKDSKKHNKNASKSFL